MAFIFPVSHDLARLVFFEVRSKQLEGVIQISKARDFDAPIFYVADSVFDAGEVVQANRRAISWWTAGYRAPHV
ncbi:hypothetical protein D3C79_1103700 [compost metagenome]